MAQFVSSPQVSSGPDPNSLFDASKVAEAGQTYQNNQLLMQGKQIDLSNANQAQVAQASAGLLSAYPDEASRAAAYPRVVGMLQSQGFAKNAPAEYPGEGALRAIVNTSVPIADQIKYGFIQPPGLGDALAKVNAPLPGQPGYGGTPASPAAASPPAGTGSGVALGMRQNNPGNLMYAGQPGAQPGQGNRFATFPDMPSGVAATADQLGLYQTQHGINTVRGAVSRWVSDPKADLTSYTADVAKALGVGPDDAVDLTDPNVQAKFILAQQPHESGGGGAVLDPADVAKGVQMAAANRGRTVQAPGATVAATAPAGGGGMQPPAPTQFAGPGAPPGSTAAPAGAPDTPWDLPGAPAPDLPPPSTPTATPAPPGTAPAQPVAPPAAGTAQPATTPPTGINSPQFQAASELNRRAADLLTRFPNSPQAQAQAAALKAQAALYMQADSVTTDPVTGIQTKQLTGERLNAAAPNAHYVWNDQQGAFVDTTGTHPPVTPPSPRITMTPGGAAIQSKSGGGAAVVYQAPPGAVQTQSEAQAAGTAAGTAAGKLVPQLAEQGRTAAQAISTIDEGMDQIQKAKAGGVSTGYFAPWITTGLAAAKSLGIDTSQLGVDPAAVGNIQTAKKTLALVSGQILQQILGPESQVTDAKIQHFIAAQPGIETDPQALERVLNWARSQFVYEREQSAQAMQDASAGGGILPANWLPGYYAAKGFAPIYNPTAGGMQQPDGQAPGREPPPPIAMPQPAPGATANPPMRVNNASDYAKVPSGQHYIDPSGHTRLKP